MTATLTGDPDQLIRLQQDSAKYEEFKLLSLLADDSEYAFQLIYDRYRNRIYQVAVRYLKSPLLGQEVVQDVFLKLWFERKNIQLDRPIEAWLYVVARNNILNRLKKIAREWKAMDSLARLLLWQTAPASEKAETAEYELLLKEAIAGLPDQQQKIFILARDERLTYAQIGNALQISPLTVKTHMTRALKYIRNFLEIRGVQLTLKLFLLSSTFFIF